MANLQIKGIDDELYSEIKALAASENRSTSQEVVYLIKCYLANSKQFQKIETPAQILLELAGSWQDDLGADEIILDLKKARKNSSKMTKDSNVFT